MGISTADIKELRARTSAGMLDCKKALTETDGDLEAAVDYLNGKEVPSEIIVPCVVVDQSNVDEFLDN